MKKRYILPFALLLFLLPSSTLNTNKEKTSLKETLHKVSIYAKYAVHTALKTYYMSLPYEKALAITP